MIDITKKWKTRCGWPVKDLIETPAGLIEGDLHRPDGRVDRFRWYADGSVPGYPEGFFLAPVLDEDEPAAPALPDLDARLYLIGCAISGAIASADADINPDPRLTAKWAVEFADEVLAMLAEQEDGAA